MNGKDVRIPNHCLLDLSFFTIWQIGVVYFSLSSLSINGINLSASRELVIIILGFVLTIGANLLFPRKGLLMGRIGIVTAALAYILMLCFPKLGVLAISLSLFSCVFIIGCHCSLEISVFEPETEGRFVLISSVANGVLWGILKLDCFKQFFSNRIIIWISLICILIYGYFFFQFPVEQNCRFVPMKENKLKGRMPRRFIIATYDACFLSVLMFVFSTSFAETVQNGVSVLYFCGAGFALLLGKQLIKWEIKQTLPIFLGVLVFGFLMAAGSFYYPVLRYPALVLLSISVLCSISTGFFLNKVFQSRPYPIVGQGLMMICLVVIILQSVLIKGFPKNFYVMAVVAITFGMVFLIYLPYMKKLLDHEQIETAAEKNLICETDTHEKKIICGELTSRDEQIVNLIMTGYSVPEIAEVLNLSPNTIKSYKKEIYFKLNVHSKRELFQKWGEA